jgi:CHAD domain-containing protein
VHPLSTALECHLETVARELTSSVSTKHAEHVHALRIASRRASVSMELLQEFLPVSELRWFQNQMTKVRRGSGVVRDLDVLLVRFPDERRVARSIAKRRERKFERICVLHRRMIASGRFAAHRQRLFASLEDNNQPIAFQASLECMVRDFLSSARRSSLRTKQLHRLRKQAKRLRYASEILSETLPPEVTERVLQSMKETQLRLGELNDHAAAYECIRSLEEHTKRTRTRADLRRIRKQERQQLKQCIEQFETFRTTNWLGDMEAALLQLLTHQ